MAATHRGSADDSIIFSQPKLFDFIANSPVITRSKSSLPEREPERISNKQRKADKKRESKKRKSTEDSTQSTRRFSQILSDALDPSQTQEMSDNSPEVELARSKIYAEYLENEITSFKSERDVLHGELARFSKSVEKYKKLNHKLTVENDRLKRNASKNSGVRRFTDIKTVPTQTDPTPASELQEATELAIAKYNSVCDHVTQIANNLLSTVADAKVSLSSPAITTAPVVPPPASQNSAEQFQTVCDRRKRHRPVVPQRIPVINTTAQLHTPPSYAQAASSSTTQGRHRPGQGTRSRRKKTIIIGSSLTDGLSAELNKHHIDSTTYIHRGGLLDDIRARVPNFFSSDISKQPDKVVLLAGGNDAEASTADRTINAYDGLVRDVRKACPQAKIIISSIPPRKNNSIINGKIKEVNDYLRDRGLRRDNVQFVDAAPTNLDMFTYKKVHFNDSGKSEFVRRIKSYLVD